MPTLYVIDINIYSVFATPVKGKVSECPWDTILQGLFSETQERKTPKFLDFLRSLHSLPLEIHIRDFALFCEHLTVSRWFIYKRKAK